MGVHGLWRLIEPSGKPVPLETLENKVLAVDVSIWLHQFVKGFQDSRGGSVPNAHLLGIYHRVCKLLYFKIKPVFVFDGGVPTLKRQAIALRNQQKQQTLSEAERIHKNLLSALVKHSAISKILSEKAKTAISASTSPPKKPKVSNDDLFTLPHPPELDTTVSSSESEDESKATHFDLHSIDTESEEFKALPVEMRHDILTDLKDTRKQSSWGRIHELPTESNDFSSYQVSRLLKRNSVQTALEQAEKEMGGHTLCLRDLENLLNDQGVITNLKGRRIASDENKRFIFIKDLKQAMIDAKERERVIEERENINTQENHKIKNKGDKEYEDDLKKAIALSLEERPSTSKELSETSSLETDMESKEEKGMSLSFLGDSQYAYICEDGDSSDEEPIQTKLDAAKNYMFEYSGLTSHAIHKLISEKSNKPNVKLKSTNPTLKIIGNQKELNKDLEVIAEVSSSKDEITEISDSDSSTNDFEDVVDSTEKTSMEIIVEPDKGLEDDLFKDVFEEVTSSQDISVKPFVPNTSNQNVESETVINNEVEEEILETVINNEIQEEISETVINSEVEEEILDTSQKSISDVSQESSSQPNTAIAEQKSSLKEAINKIVQNYAKQTMPNDADKSKITEKELSEMQENLSKEQNELMAQRLTKERHAENITDQICQDVQELLEIFGVPYIIAPMEAEAQCAFLDMVGLTNGTITDDSDIWLFGGKTVYKNFFDQNKNVMEFRAENIQNHYKLSREQMILLAILVGSDYTVGLSGVGPVTALEILAAFPPKSQLTSGLAEFKVWFNKGKAPGPGRTALRGKLKNVTFTESFPNPRVVQAYLEPTVETSKEPFTWAKPDIAALTDFAQQKFGWSRAKSEGILNPIIRRSEETKSQKSIKDYFKVELAKDSGGVENKMSKRVKSAVNKIGRGCVEEEENPKPRVKKKGKGEPKVKKKKIVEDEEIQILKETEADSKKRVEAIYKDILQETEKQKKVNITNLHKREVIPQKLKDKSEMLKNKLKAIETFRKSKQGPGYVKKRVKKCPELKEDTSYLSESSSSD